jgi:predicted cobalt transporter CbtA
MTSESTTLRTWIRVAGTTGIASVFSYFGAAFLPLPDVATRLLAFAFGPLLVVSFLGMYRYLSRQVDGPVLQTALLFGVIAGAMVTSMLVVQVGNNMVRADVLESAETESAREAVNLAWRAVNRVQYLLDVVWDIFICGALILLGTAMLRHPRYGKIWGGVGILVASLLLILNLQTFPEAPAYAGSVDLGPLAALWMLTVFIRTLLIRE